MHIMYAFDDSYKSPKKPSYYKLGVLPIRHWYQRRVGWFGQFALVSLLLGAAGYGGLNYAVSHVGTKPLAAQTDEPKKAHKIASSLEQTKAQNIIDVQSVLDEWVSAHPGQKWGIAAKSLDGPSFEASYNADKKFRSASIYKLFLTLPLFQQIPAEHQKNITLNVNDSKKSLATCVDLMLRLSDNPCGEAVGDYLSWSKAQKTLNSNGFAHTTFGQDKLETSASDTALFLEKLQGDMMSRPAKDTIMRSLYEQRWRKGIPAGCPGCVTANKTGSIDTVTHDAAVVKYSGGSYVLVIFSESGNFKQIAELTGRIQQKILDTTRPAKPASTSIR